jgi:hypothetical protein
VVMLYSMLLKEVQHQIQPFAFQSVSSKDSISKLMNYPSVFSFRFLLLPVSLKL